MRIFGKIFNGYRDKYYISPYKFEDLAETNRIHMLLVSKLLFVFGLVSTILLIILNRPCLTSCIPGVIYFSIFTTGSIFCYILSRLMEKTCTAPPPRIFVPKNIPVYAAVFSALGAGVYNFYILDQPFNGVLVCILTGFVALSTFSFSPIPFLAGITVSAAVLAPGVYTNFGITGLADTIIAAALMFCLSMNKRRIEKKQIILLGRQKNSLEVKTFGNFTIIYEGRVVRFSRTKSNELMAYLVYKKGTSVNSRELISVLWGERAESSRYGSSLRNLIVDIKASLAQLEIQNFFIAEYNNFRINPEVIKCDYYGFLSGDTNSIKAFAGEFMSQYSWAEDTAGYLEMKAGR